MDAFSHGQPDSVQVAGREEDQGSLKSVTSGLTMGQKRPALRRRRVITYYDKVAR
jgi:hypothetical protein